MSTNVISIENVSKSYRLGVIGTGTFYGDLKRWWTRQRGKPDPYLKIGEVDYGNRDGETIWALKDITFAVKQGDAIGVLGRNGAGKSTLLKILSRVTAPTTGAVKVKGRIASLLEVGTGFHPELTGRENIFLNGAIMGMGRVEVNRKLDEIVDFSGVEKFIDTPVKRYSSGMYVRLAFAVAAHLEPEILVVDEVLAVGDAEFQKKCLGKMSDVASAGRTVLFVSHNMSAIRKLCSSAVLIDQGKVNFSGDVDSTIQFYLDRLNEKEFDTGPAVRNDYSANTAFKVLKIRVKNPENDGQPTTGHKLEILLDYATQDEHDLSKLYVGFTVQDELGANVFACSTGMTDADFYKAPAAGQISCQIDRLPLIPGRYSLTFKLVSNNLVADVITNIASFEVIDNGDTGITNYIKRSWGSVLVPHDWSITNHE